MRIFFSPECPHQQDYSIVAMIHYLGYSVVRSASEPFDVAYLWRDATVVSPPAELVDIANTKPVLNIACTDISKIKVDQVWQQISGHSALIDPTMHQGKAIKKFDANGQGGGEIVDCPLAVTVEQQDVVYQQYIETNPAGPQLEYRVPIVMGKIPAVFKVFKDDPETVAGKRIKNQFKHSITLASPDVIFSDQEQAEILEFCSLMGFDIGELDVLRCANTHRLYVIDVNTTPTYFNMFNRYWQPEEKRKAIAKVSQCWESQLQQAVA